MYIIIFKISDKRDRRNLEKLLLSYGRKIKSGVFECKLTLKYFRELSNKLKYFHKAVGNGDFIKTYTICGKCEQKIFSVGSSAGENDPLYYIV